MLGKMVGFVLTKDYDKAKAFYEGTLGCEGKNFPRG